MSAVHPLDGRRTDREDLLQIGRQRLVTGADDVRRGIVRQPAFVTVSPNDRTLCGTGGAALGRPFRDVSQPATGNSGPGGSDSEHEAARDLVRF